MIRLPKLYAIVDVEVSRRAGWSPRDLTKAYLEGGARLLQVRAKTLGGAAFLDVAASIVELAHAAGARVVLNDRADLAVLAFADGVHLGQDDLPPVAARRVMGSEAMLGLSTHTVEQIEKAVQAPISYLAIGPVFETLTKATGYHGGSPAIVAAAAQRAAALSLPVVAIGGITLQNVSQVIAAGASSVAVITDLLAGGDPAARVRAYLRELHH